MFRRDKSHLDERVRQQRQREQGPPREQDRLIRERQLAAPVRTQAPPVQQSGASPVELVAARLRQARPTRRVGQGTSSSPMIIWICPELKNNIPRQDGIDEVCRIACTYTGSNIVWVRQIDHRTTQMRSGRNRQGGRRGQRSANEFVQADPHITVYMGRSSDPYQVNLQGHLYVSYHRQSDVPRRLAEPQERRVNPEKPNPDLHDIATGQQVIFGRR